MSEPDAPAEPPPEPNRWLVSLEGVRLLDRYRVERKIGGGGMASVYLAYDEQLDQPVVVKVPHPALLAEPGFRERFDRETRDLVSLQHPHIVSILARGEHEDLPFLVMQYLKGGSLGDRMRMAKGEPLPYADVRGWVRDVARALDAIHAQGVVHRDIKPDNVLFDEHGNAYLSDFGIAKAVGGADTGLTVTGTTPGSPAYMAPEQPRSSSLTGQSDQYSLAATIYEALSGEPTFEGETVVDVLIKKQTEDPTPIAELVPSLPAGVDAALSRGLSRSVGDRFDTCQEMAAVLLGETQDVEVRAPEPTVASVPSVPSPPPRPAPVAPPEPPPADSTRSVLTWVVLGVVLLGGLGLIALIFGLLTLGRIDPEDGPEPSGPTVSAADAELVGTYEIDVDALLARMKGRRAEPRIPGKKSRPRRPSLEEMMRSGMTLTIQADGRFELKNERGAERGLGNIRGKWVRMDDALILSPDERPRSGSGRDPLAGETFKAVVTTTGLELMRKGFRLPLMKVP